MQERENFLNEASGATAIEYAMIAGGIALVLIAVVFNLGASLSGILGAIAAALGA
ncbi:MAG TPA: Flp family type IVb pilin [Alphaproteobacteria bacterium]|nr:pilus assembly protein Flp/PilA [Alphaproteobacteria bacterium]HEX4890871.1 Flp family type IVb pilin [Alphaproteobacteria bacterium]